MSEKEFKNNRPKSDEKDLEGLVQNFSQKVEPAAKKVKKTVGKIERQGMHAAEHYTGDDYNAWSYGSGYMRYGSQQCH